MQTGLKFPCSGDFSRVRLLLQDDGGRKQKGNTDFIKGRKARATEMGN